MSMRQGEDAETIKKEGRRTKQFANFLKNGKLSTGQKPDLCVN